MSGKHLIKLFRVTVAGSLTLVMAACGGNQPPSGQPAAPSREISLESLKAASEASNTLALQDALEKAAAAMPQSAYVISAKAEELGPNPDAIFAFVRDQVRYEVYPGALRGARGALMGLAGNAYDKSLLLAALLTHHKIGVRYVRAQLPEDRAAMLVAQMLTALPNLTAAPLPRVPVSNAEAVVTELGSLVRQRIISQLGLIQEAFERNKITVADAPPASAEILRREAADHVWVEYERSGEWIALDPSFRDAQPGQSSAAGERHDEIPLSNFHQVTVRLVQERRGNQLKTIELLSHTAPAATLHGAEVTFRYEIVPAGAGWTAKPLLQIGQEAIRGEMSAAGGTGAVGSVPGGRVFTGLRGEQSPATDEFVAEWLEFTLVIPGGRTDRVRREIVDRIAPADRGDRAAAPLQALGEFKGIPLYLHSIYGLAFTSGSLHPALLVTRALAHKEAVRKTHALLFDPSGKPRNLSDAEKKELAGMTKGITPGLLSHRAMAFHVTSQRSLLSMRHWFPSGSLWFYEAGPRLAVSSLTMVGAGTDTPSGQHALDLRWNPVRVVGADVSGTQVVSGGIFQGIVDATWEQMLVTPLPKEGAAQAASSAVAVIEAARAAGSPIVVIATPEDARRVEGSPDQHARMVESLDGGAIVVAPSRPVGGKPGGRLAWWRINTSSGLALAVLDTGLYAAEEYTATISLMDFLGALVVAGSFIVGIGFIAWLAYEMAYQQGRNRGQYESNERRRGNCAFTTGSCTQTCGDRPGYPACSNPIPNPPACGPYMPITSGCP